jgi:hypothetical protein
MRAAAGQFAGQFAEAGAEFEHAFACADEGRECAYEPAHVAHEGVDQAEVAAVVERVGMIVRKGIEQFGGEAAFHARTVGGRVWFVKRRRRLFRADPAAELPRERRSATTLPL